MAKNRNAKANAKNKSSLRQVVKQKRKNQVQSTQQKDSNGKSSFAPPKLSASKALGRQHLKQKQKELRNMQMQKNRVGLTASLESMTAKAQVAAEKYDQHQKSKSKDAEEKQHPMFRVNDSSRRAYMREMRKVVDQSDVILQVLDARDPMGCRSIDSEQSIMARSDKKMVLVLNKIDLVPREVLGPWLQILRRDFPTIAFKASTQDQSNHIAQTTGKADRFEAEKLVQTSRSVGTDALMQLLKNYCRNSSMKTSITVGIIGYPNVGKSSLINSLKRSKSVGVSPTAGFTKCLQEVHLDKKIKLIDSPGIVFDDKQDPAALFLRNCINVEALEDPIPAVEALVNRGISKTQLQTLYNISSFEDVMMLLVHVANKLGKLSRGGIPDRKAAARAILSDWNKGKIPYYTPPPSADSQNGSATGNSSAMLESSVVSTFSEEFDLDKVLNPTSIVLSDAEEDSEDVNVTANNQPSTVSFPQCSIVVNENSTSAKPTAQSTTIANVSRSSFRTNSDSDSGYDSDETPDMENDADMDTRMAVDGSTTANISTKVVFEEDLVNPKTAQMSRKEAKKLRKQKRKARRQQVDSAVENMICEDVETMTMSLSAPPSQQQLSFHTGPVAQAVPAMDDLDDL